MYEIKFDGYRAVAFKEAKDVKLVSRNNKTFDYLQLLDSLKSLPRSMRKAARRSSSSTYSKDPEVCPAGLLRLRPVVPPREKDLQPLSGQRSHVWVKFEITKSQEFVVGGYTLPEAGRKYFGSVLVS